MSAPNNCNAEHGKARPLRCLDALPAAEPLEPVPFPAPVQHPGAVTNLPCAPGRCYDPATGRWFSAEPLRYDDGDADCYRYADFSTLTYEPASMPGATSDGLFEYTYESTSLDALVEGGPVAYPWFAEGCPCCPWTACAADADTNLQYARLRAYDSTPGVWLGEGGPVPAGSTERLP